MMRDKTDSSNQGLKTRNVLISLAALIGMTILIVIVLRPAWSRSGMAPGFDAASFIFSSKFLVDTVIAKGSVPRINPYWYNGFELLHNAPILAYVFLGSLYLLFKNPELVSKLGQILIVIGIAASMFLVVRKNYGLFAGTIAAFLLALGPMTLWEVVASGSYHRIMGMIFYPPAFYFIDQLAQGKRTGRNLALLVLFQSLAVLSHPMVGAGLMLFLSLYLLLRLFVDHQSERIPTLGFWLASIVLTIGLTSWYLGPFFLERIGWISLPEEIYKLNSLPIWRLLYLVGLPSLALAVYGGWRRRSATDKALLAVIAVCIIFALGSYLTSALYSIAQVMYPFVAVYFAIFAVSYLAATVIADPEIMRSRAVVGLAIISLTIPTLILGYRDVSMDTKLSGTYHPESEQETLVALRQRTSPGRVMPMKYPFTYLIWWIPVESNKPMVEGWFYSLTPTGKEIAWIYDAIDRGFPEYAVKILKLMNVRYFVANGVFEASGPKYSAFLKLMKQEGFVLISATDSYRIYEKRGRSYGYLQPVEQTTLVVGKNAYSVSTLVPGAIGSQSVYVDDLSLETLRLFDTVVLSGFGYRDQKSAEDLIKSYVRQGGRVVVDLSNLEGDPFEKDPGFLGVTPIEISFDGVITFQKDSEDSVLEDIDLRPTIFSYQGEPWRALAYIGLDKTLLHVDDHGRKYSIAGYRQIDGRRIYFLGGNLAYHAYEKHNKDELQLVRNLASATVSKKRSLDMGDQSLQPEEIRFSYQAKEPLPFIVSYAWSPHWRATIDGKALEVQNVSDLIMLALPAGNHSVEVRYGNTGIHYATNALSFVTLAFLGFLTIKRQRRAEATGEEAE